jgi:hypothetical protein
MTQQQHGIDAPPVWWSKLESPMKRASYRNGIEHIALNDDPTELDESAVAGSISVGLLADLFGVEVERVAKDVVRFRKKQP